MLYPQNLLEKLGKNLLQIDFIGPRFLENESEKYHFISCKYVRPFKLHIFIRVKNQTTSEVLNSFYTLFFVLKLPLPDVVQMDNDSAFRGCIERKGCIGRVIKWLCGNGIISLFSAQSSPWNNGSVEGGNSVFDKKFWQKFHFQSIEAVDEKLKAFNAEYQNYLIKDYDELIQTKKPVIDPRKNTKWNRYSQSKIYFLRIVKERYEKCSVEVLGYYIKLSANLKGQFVLIEVSLDTKTVKIFQEIKSEKILIYQSSIILNL